MIVVQQVCSRTTYLFRLVLNIACGFNSSVVILLRHASSASSHRVPRKAQRPSHLSLLF